MCCIIKTMERARPGRSLRGNSSSAERGDMKSRYAAWLRKGVESDSAL